MNFSKLFKFFLIAIFFIGIISPIFVFAADPIKFCAQVTIPGFDLFTKDKCTPVSTNTIADTASGMYKFIAGIAGIAAVIVMMAGGYVWLFAGGNASKVGEAKSLIGSAVLGLVLVLGSYTILNLINPELIKLKSLDNIAGIDPISAKTMPADAICSQGEEEEAQEKNQKDTGLQTQSDTCGRVYKERNCIRVLCPKSDDSVCVLNANPEGEFTGGGCRTSVSILRTNPENNSTGKLIYVVDEKNGMTCGQVTKPYQCGIASTETCVYKSYDKCNAMIRGFKNSTCLLIYQEGQKEPFVDNNKDWVYYYYKGKKDNKVNTKTMDCAPGYE